LSAAFRRNAGEKVEIDGGQTGPFLRNGAEAVALKAPAAPVMRNPSYRLGEFCSTFALNCLGLAHNHPSVLSLMFVNFIIPSFVSGHDPPRRIVP
jgi:hypothetical protein